MKREIDEFAQNLVRFVRDAAIGSNDRELLPTAGSPVGKRWRKAAKEESPEDFARVLIPDVVDDTIFYLLHAIDDGGLTLTFTASNGKTVNLTEEGLGELAGWYMGNDGWCGMYSTQRFVDDVADLG
jgi:hypothetical protein